MGVKFKGIEEVEPFFDLYEEMFNNTRMTFHRGHTPNEIYKESGTQYGPSVRKALRLGNTGFKQEGVLKTGVPDADPKSGYMGEAVRAGREVNSDGTNPIPIAENVSRNALCPCGSGKKYKRCCGMKPVNLS